jgi:hypothetical protein
MDDNFEYQVEAIDPRNKLRIYLKGSKTRKRWSHNTVSATLTLSFLSFNSFVTSSTTSLTFSGGNSLAAAVDIVPFKNGYTGI